MTLCQNLFLCTPLVKRRQDQIRKKLSRFSNIFICCIFLFTSTSLAQTSQPGLPSDPIKIAAVFSLTGIAAPHNRPLVQVTQLAIKHLNQNGGILNRPVELIVFDNLSTPIGSALAAKEIVNRKIPAVVGAHWSSHSLAMADILQKAGITMISPGSTNPEITPGRNFIFRACFIDSFQGQAMAKFARDNLNADTAVVVANIDEDYSTNLAQFFSSEFSRRGGMIKQEVSYRGDATDFTENINTILKHKPDVVYLPGYTRDSGLFIKQAKRLGVTATFLGGDGWDEIEKYGGESIEGSFQSAPWHPQVPFAKSDELKKIFKAAYGADIKNTSSPLAFDAVMILAKAIESAGSIEPVNIRDALSKTELMGATGKIAFDINGDPVGKAAIIIKFKDNSRIFTQVVTP